MKDKLATPRNFYPPKQDNSITPVAKQSWVNKISLFHNFAILQAKIYFS
jgi:hypothetical protein